MSFPPIHKATALYLSWLGGLCGAIVLMLGENILPFRLPFATPAQFFGAVVGLELFFILLVWPIFVPSLLKEGSPALALLAYAGVLILLGLPLVLIAANVSSVGGPPVLRTQVQLAALAALGSGVVARFPGAGPWYLLAAFFLAAALPFWGFLNFQLGNAIPPISPYVSPFWGASSTDAAPSWVQSGLFGAAGLALLVRTPTPRPV